MLKGHVFNLQTFTSECFALFIDTFLNKKMGIVRGCVLSNTNTSVSISEGFFVVKGRFLEIISSETVNVIEDGFYSLVCEIDLSKTNTTTALNQAVIKALKGTNNYPSITKNDICDGTNTLYQYEFAQFKVENSVIKNFVDKRTFVNISSIYEKIEEETSKLITNIENELENVQDGSAYLLKSGGSINGNLEVGGSIKSNTIVDNSRSSLFKRNKIRYFNR